MEAPLTSASTRAAGPGRMPASMVDGRWGTVRDVASTGSATVSYSASVAPWAKRMLHESIDAVTDSLGFRNRQAAFFNARAPSGVGCASYVPLSSPRQDRRYRVLAA